MTGPFAPPPADGADRWSDQEPDQGGTPAPPDPVLPESPGAVEPPPTLAGPPPTPVGPPPTPADPPAVPANDAPATAPVETVSLVKAPTAPPTPPAVPPAGPSAPPAPVPQLAAEPAPATTETSVPTVSLSKAPGVGAPPTTPSAGRRSALPLALVGLLTVLMVLGVGYLGFRLDAERQTAAARDEAIAASRDAARLLFSYDHTTLDEDFAKGLSVTTGQFRDDYMRTTSQVVAGVARQYKAVVVADVVESAVIEASPDEVTTLVFLNQATTSTQITGQQVDQSRVRMRLVERGGRWLVTEVQAL